MEYEQIKKIINDMSASSLNSLNIEFPDGIKINITKDNNTSVQQVIQTPKENVEEKLIKKDYAVVASPMVGTLYLKPSPEKNEFVKVGDTVKKGQTLCIVEAMKLMNEIESEYDGKIVEICASNEEMVDYGKPLFKIEEV